MNEERPGYNYLGVTLPGLTNGETPLGAVVLLKVLNADGEIKYREHKSPDLHYVEALGMATTYVDTCRGFLLRNSRPGHH